MQSSNQAINVNSFYFTNGSHFKSFPKQIEAGQTSYTFIDGMQYSIQKGGHRVKLFDMFDGQRTYRLRYENDTWTLVNSQ